ncbi:hypothetical protein EV651_104356 [Kribbella sp. VKM Ac-2571]|uniref:hypothetical protein n=1 Tax=Kribbella sp. VKM Ac-2571 TaxID=2512222 RepID=UPI0010E90942|nr:hypothetical protein [Kribbella sp. VKM Ac-2571]TDO66789.1 hypothetical protein EV651_104356 [Kribbella sp. VKM Ac-2571]
MGLKRASAVAASAVLLGSLATLPGSTASASATAACTMSVGSITAGGNFGGADVTASAPPAAQQSTGPHVFTAGITKASSTWTNSGSGPDGTATSTALVILNDTLYQAAYTTGSTQPPLKLDKVGSGWSNFIAVEESFWQQAPGSSVSAGAWYGLLGGTGVLNRWAAGPDGIYRHEKAGGFGSVKAMTLISETKTYDTFLANTRGGALYTIRIPRTSPLKPIVTRIRTATWQGFEALVADKCGTQSTLLTAIDKDTGSAYLYAVGHTNGTATAIRGLGKLPGTYKDPAYFNDTAEGAPPLNGD